jgi:broad specificity phosphatase PhoE
MILYFVRHGQTVDNLNMVFPDKFTELTENGKKEAKELKEYIKDINFDAIYSSPFRRTVQTTEILTDKNYIKDNRLIDVNTGNLEGKSIEEISKNDKLWYSAFQDSNNNRYNVELFDNVKKRLNNFINDIKDNGYERVLVVTHLEPVRAMYSLATQTEGLPLTKIEINNCSVSVFSYTDGNLYLKVLNWLPIKNYGNEKNKSFY